VDIADDCNHQGHRHRPSRAHPLPALRTRKALSRLAPGAMLVVECTDPLAEIDIPNLLHETGDALESAVQQEGVLVLRIRKRGGASYPSAP
jgi:tRNA 2-thiouridine synthesizing protein A